MNASKVTHWTRVFALAACLSAAVSFGVAAESAHMQKLRLRAEQGDGEAQYSLGVNYSLGHVVPRNEKVAVRWFRKAAEQGNAGAQLELGWMYDHGQGMPQSYKLALRWYRKAAEQGDASAQYGLSVMYANGQGVPQDYVQAHKWINLAASQSQNAEYRKTRNLVAKQMTPGQIAEAQKLAREWKPKR